MRRRIYLTVRGRQKLLKAFVENVLGKNDSDLKCSFADNIGNALERLKPQVKKLQAACGDLRTFHFRGQDWTNLLLFAVLVQVAAVCEQDALRGDPVVFVAAPHRVRPSWRSLVRRENLITRNDWPPGRAAASGVCGFFSGTHCRAGRVRSKRVSTACSVWFRTTSSLTK